MPWTTPKRDWTAANVVLASDLNRIEGNIAFLHDEYILSGPESARPAPGHPGRLYIATGLAQRIWRDTGTAWELVAGVPRGVIQMWSGSVDTIPLGWVLADGRTATAADGTQVTVPDLRDRFIVGAGLNYAVGATGGAAQVTLTADQLPPHSHPAACGTAGAHTHTGTTSTDGAHNHTYTAPARAGLMSGSDWPIYDSVTTATTSTNGAHSHTLTINSAGDHTHAITVGSAGSGQPHENRPPYFALALIYKL